MTDELPLPIRSCIVTFLGDGRGLHYMLGSAAGEPLVAQPAGSMLDLFTADQMREYAAAAVAREREREREACAALCDDHASIEGIAQRCAAAIRAR